MADCTVATPPLLFLGFVDRSFKTLCYFFFLLNTWAVPTLFYPSQNFYEQYFLRQSFSSSAYGSFVVCATMVRVQVVYLYFNATFILQRYVTVLHTDIGLLILPQEFQ